MPWEAVLGHLDVPDLCHVAATCRRLRNVAQSPSLWRRLAEALEPAALHEATAAEGWRQRFIGLYRHLNLSGRRFIVQGLHDGATVHDAYSYHVFVTYESRDGLFEGHGSFDHGQRFQVRGRRRGRAVWFVQRYHTPGFQSSAIAVSALLSLPDPFVHMSGSWTNSDGISGVFQAFAHDAPPAIRNAAFQALVAPPLPPCAPRGVVELKPLFPYPLWCVGDTVVADEFGIEPPGADVRGFHALEYAVDPDKATPDDVTFGVPTGLHVFGVWAKLVTVVSFSQSSNRVWFLWGTRTEDGGTAWGACDEYDAPPEADDCSALEFQRTREKWTLLPGPKE